MQRIIDTQNKVVEHKKQKNNKTLFQILIVIDDFADENRFPRSSKLLHSLFTRGRHSSISTIVATQNSMLFIQLSGLMRVVYMFSVKELFRFISFH